MISFLVLHWIAALCGSGFLAVFGAAGSAIGWPVVLKDWKQILVALVFVVLLIVAIFFYVEWQRAKAEEAQYAANFQTIQNQAETLNSDNLNLVGQLKAQSGSIAAAQAAEFAARAAAVQAQQAAQAQQAGDAKTIAALQARAADPKTNKGTCDEELQVIRAGL